MLLNVPAGQSTHVSLGGLGGPAASIVNKQGNLVSGPQRQSQVPFSNKVQFSLSSPTLSAMSLLMAILVLAASDTDIQSKQVHSTRLKYTYTVQ